MSTTRQGARLGVEDCGRRAEPVPPRSIALLQLFELPSPMAHALQIARTAHALVREGIEAHVFVRAGREVDVRAELASLSGHALDPGLRVHRFATRHKGLAGLRLRARSVWLAGQGVAFYGRQRRQTLDLARFVRCAERLGRRRPTVVYEFHNLDHVLAAERGDARAAARVRGEEARLLRVVDRVTAISAPLAADVEAFARASGVSLPAGGVTVIPDGVDLAAFDGVALRSIADGAPRSPLGQTGATVVYAGSLHAHKGVATLIDAFRTLPQRFALRIVGGHPPAELAALRATVEADPRLLRGALGSQPRAGRARARRPDLLARLRVRARGALHVAAEAVRGDGHRRPDRRDRSALDHQRVARWRDRVPGPSTGCGLAGVGDRARRERCRARAPDRRRGARASAELRLGLPRARDRGELCYEPQTVNELNGSAMISANSPA